MTNHPTALLVRAVSFFGHGKSSYTPAMISALFLAASAMAGAVDVTRTFPADQTLVVTEEVVRTQHVGRITDTRRIKSTSELSIYSGGRYRKHDISYRVYLSSIAIEVDKGGTKRSWSSDSSAPPDPELWNLARRPTTWQVTVDRIGVPTVSFDEQSQGARPDDNHNSVFEAQTASDIASDTEGWLRGLPSAKVKTTKPLVREVDAPAELEIDQPIKETWTFVRWADELAIYSVRAELARPASPGDPVQTLSGKGQVSFDADTGVAVAEDMEWSMRVATLREPKRIVVKRSRSTEIKGAVNASVP